MAVNADIESIRPPDLSAQTPERSKLSAGKSAASTIISIKTVRSRGILPIRRGSRIKTSQRPGFSRIISDLNQIRLWILTIAPPSPPRRLMRAVTERVI